jgi:O-antigen ligase
MFMGHIRAFSFFGSGLSAGIFYCFTGSIATSLALDKRLRTRALGIVMLAMSGFGVYATLTRLTLVGFCFSVIAVLVLRLVKAPIITNWMPLGWGIAAIAVIGATILAPGGGSRADIASTSSMAERLFEWGIFGAKFVSGSFSNMVFGSAVTPYKPLTVLTMPATSATIPIDNGYLEVLLNSGLVGLGLVIYFYKQCWIAICEKSRTTKSHLLQGTAAFFSVLPFFAGINDLPSEFFMIFAFAMYFEN